MASITHIDIGGTAESGPVVHLCGLYLAQDDCWHVSELEGITIDCPECLEHPDLPMHILKHTDLED